MTIAAAVIPDRLRALPRPPLALVFLLAALLVVSRRPGVLLHATFWAEDGWRWYPEAYTMGWSSLFKPWTGYLQTISRLVALAAQPFPLSWAPTLFAGAAILVQAGVATFMLSDRLAELCPRWTVRAAFALLYVLLPNSFEVYANLTNVQWHLALLAFLVCVGRPPAGAVGRGFDLLVLVLSGLSGPCCVFVLPVALWRAFMRGDRADLVRFAILLLCVVVQLWCLFGGGGGRAAPPLGAGPRRLTLILSLQVILPLLIGRHSDPVYTELPWWTNGVMPAAVFALAAALTARTLVVGPAAVRFGCVFAGGIMLAALVRPAIGSSDPAWFAMSHPDVGDRYYVMPMLCWGAVLFAAAADRWVAVRYTARALLLLAAVMLPGDWHLPSGFTFGGRTDFVQRARSFADAPSGTVMSFPVNPVGVEPMVLRKR
ncbi:hypothetical protein [Rhizosaccharibacter radicis]|uniref:DUF2029 domain-containing protein n=1 Tax=Rhizosaccharibacter radicis TaxID=2782605 RepID=A0ABT1VVW9_9PROT|nr:hypothetical protein [Acetobacteraceae bacterium KSS12]